jgi:tetraacyldisaccharide 4'-kinase
MFRSAVARALEDGRMRGAVIEVVSRAMAPLAKRSLARPAGVPAGLRTVTVGGATLGGSGKSRVAVAIATQLSEEGACVVLVGHAYRARPRRARVVSRGDPLAEVGDEALVCARALDGKARVVVARSRAQAIAYAAALSPRPDVLVIDGPLQLGPARASLSVLALDAHEPWGSGAVFPAGDLRAPIGDLLAAADLVVRVDALPPGLDRFAGRRIGLFTALARPRRLVSALARAGIEPASVVQAPDHGPVSRSDRRILGRVPVEAWLATPKCATHLAGSRLSAPLVVVEASLPRLSLPTWAVLTPSDLPP